MKILGIDFGSKRVGIAVSDDRAEFAMPETVIDNNRDASSLVNEVLMIAERVGAKEIVVGESKDYKGKPNSIMAQVDVFVALLSKKEGYTIHLEPEFMTSMNAERVRKELGGKSEHIDASAAALILQSFLDKRKNGVK